MRTKIVQTLAPLLALIVWAGLCAALTAQANTGHAGVDPAYAAGYNAAYDLGVKDKAAGVGANARKFTAYEDGTAGYTPAYGPQDTYRTRFQNGFSDGYFDGYNGRERAFLTPPPPAPQPELQPTPAPAPPPSLDTTAQANGYREGYNIGQSDANSNAVYNSTASNEYQQALVGYSPSIGSSTDYQTAFRQGFTQGYDDGFNHRLYNSSLGARATPAPPPAASGANNLPLSAADAATRPSGVYANGILLAQGTVIQTQLDKELDTKTAYAGEAFTLTTTVPIWVGAVAAIPAGSKITGIVQSVQRGGKLSGHAQLQLQYNTLIVPGEAPIPLNATTNGVGNSAQTVNGQEGTVNGQGADTAKKAGTAAAVGAVLGGIFGGYGGLARGAIAGAAVGTAGVLISHKKDITLRAGEIIAVRLDHPLQLPKPAAVQ